MIIDTFIEQAYHLFSSYTISRNLDVCKICCITDEEEKQLVCTPLRQLSSELLQAYIESARCYSEKEQKEMCYFLPRILEIFVQGGKNAWWMDNSLFNRLFDQGGKKFIGSQEEFEFLNNFYLEYFRIYINHYPQDETSIEILILFGKSFNINPLFNFWSKSQSLAAIFHFSDLIINLDYYDYQLTFLGNQRVNDLVLIWLKNENTKKHFLELIENVYFNNTITDYELILKIESAYTLYVNNFHLT